MRARMHGAYVRVPAPVGLRGPIRAGRVNGHVCGFRRNVGRCLAATQCTHADPCEMEGDR